MDTIEDVYVQFPSWTRMGVCKILPTCVGLGQDIKKKMV